MKKYFAALILFLAYYSASSQSNAVIQNTDFAISNDTIIITYDLAKSKKGECFTISISILTKSGKTFIPKGIVGDVGANVFGGNGKRITWDLKKDNVYFNEPISVEITAIPESPSLKFFSRGAAVALSAVVPGLGITKLNRGGPYWIMAIGFYGVAAGSYLYYNSAKDNYQKYLDSRDEDQRNSLYSTSTNQNTISEALLYTAAAIWAGNMIWTLVTTNKTKPKMNLGFYYDSSVKQPLLSLQYQF
jgi:hypothetical protein